MLNQRAHDFAFKKIVNQQELGDDETVLTLQNDFLSVSDMNMGNLSFEAPSDEELNKVEVSLSKLSRNILDALKKGLMCQNISNLAVKFLWRPSGSTGKKTLFLSRKQKK